MRVRLTDEGRKVADSLEIPEAVREKFESIFRKGKLVLFMTYGMTLQKWDEIGILERELKPYNELAKYMESIHIVTYGDCSEDQYKEGFLKNNIVLLTNDTGLPDFLYSIFASWIHRKVLREADIFKTNQMAGTWAAVIAKKLFRKKLVVRQGYPWLQFLIEKNAPWWKKELARLTEYIAYKEADYVNVTKEEDRQNIIANHWGMVSKTNVVPNYIDTELFKPEPSLRQKNRVLFVGRLSPQKNLFSLIRGIKYLDAELVIIGEGELKQQLIELTITEGIKNVRFIGNMKNEDLVQEYNKANIFILSSLFEGAPKTLMEAMSCGCIIIGTDVQGINDLITDRISGYLTGCSPEQIGASISWVLFMIKNNEIEAQKMRNNAREIIIKKHSLESVIKKELKIYRENNGV